MFTQATMLIHALKQKASMKLLTLASFAMIMVSCVGTSSVPVTYVLPVQGGVYTTATFLPELEFPNGVPNQAGTIIRLNGAEIQSAFDVWSGTTARVSSVGAPNFNIIAGALRDGRNNFQVFEPNKGMVTFNVDVDTASVHVVKVVDNWDGVTAKPNNLTVYGYIEGAGYTTIENMSVQVRRLDNNGNPTNLADHPSSNSAGGQYMIVAPGNTVNEGAYYLTLYDDDHVTTDQRDLWDRPYGFVMRIYDADADGDLVTIGAQKRDLQGNLKPWTYKHWMRSNIPLYDQRLNNNGAFSLALDQIALKSTGVGVAEAIDDMEVTVYEEDCAGCVTGYRADIRDMTFNNTSVDLSLPWQNSSTNANIRVDARIPVDSGNHGSVTVWALWIPVTCTISGPATLTFGANFSLNVGGGDQTNMSSSGESLGGVGDLIDGACGAIAGFFVGILQGTIVDTITGIVEDMFNVDLPKMRLVVKIGDEIHAPVNSWDNGSGVHGSVPGTYYPGEYLFGAYLFELQPKMMNFYGRPNSWVSGATSWDIAWGLNLGFHALGTGINRIPSLGTQYYQQTTAPATLAIGDNDQERALGVRTLGATLSEMFINQLFMGLWESGILYIDMDFGSIVPIPGQTVVLDDVKFAFASNAPWEVDILPNGSPEGDAIVKIPDLRVELIGDAHDASLPDNGNDYTFAYMIGDLTLYFIGGVSPEGGALRFEQASTVELAVTDVYSDWDGTTPEQLVSVFDYAFTFLTPELTLDIPFPEILGSTVQFGDIKSDNGGFQVTIDVWNNDVFPSSPRDKITSLNFINASSGGYGSTTDLEDRVPSNYNTYGASGTAHFHAIARGRNTRRDCTATDQWGSCTAHTCYYWNEPSFDWGFRFDTVRAVNVDEVRLVKRSGQEGRVNNIRLYPLYNGSRVGNSSGYTSTDAGASRVYDLNGVVANGYELLVYDTWGNDSQHHGYGNTSYCTSTGDKTGHTTGSDSTINIAEIFIIEQ